MVEVSKIPFALILSPWLVDIQVEILRRLSEIMSLELNGEVGTEDVNVGSG